MHRLPHAPVILDCLLVAPAVGHAAEPVKIKFTLDWKPQGIHARYYWAEAKGYFTAEPLDVRIDQGDGSAAAALLTRTNGPIKTLKDFEGSKLGSLAGGASFNLLPLLAKQNGIDYGKINITRLPPSLREQMLIQGQVDSVAVSTATSYMNLISLTLDRDKDFGWMYYSDCGLDLHSNGIMVSPKLAREHPDAVKGLLCAMNRSLKETVENPGAAIDLPAAEEPLTYKAIERRRLLYVYKTLINTPEMRERGIGDVGEAKLKSAVATIAAAFELPKEPAPGEIFDRFTTNKNRPYALGYCP